MKWDLRRRESQGVGAHTDSVARQTSSPSSSKKPTAKSGAARKPARKKGWNYPRKGLGPLRRWLPSWRVLLGTFLGGLALVVGVIGTAYLVTDVPEPDQLAIAEGSTVYFSDGVTPIGTLAEVDRTIIDPTLLPTHVGAAVVASEDRRFYSNAGIDPIGIARALWNNLRGGSRQGGSTLTQQYIENYYLGKTTGYAGKFKEAILAVKIEQELDKDEILGAYLNTIYFGRGAYGIEAAAQAYFGKSAVDLTVSESAMIAGIIPAPSAWDPAKSPDQAEHRWARTLDFMEADGVITAEERAAQVFPTVIEYSRSDRFGGTNGYLLQLAIDELTGGEDAQFSEGDLNRLGMGIVTTFDATMQAAAVDTIENKMPEGHAENLKATLVSIDPATGGVRALYGGTDFLTEQYNRATQAAYQGGSTFKPFTLIAALEQGIPLEETYASASPMDIDGWEVNNFDRRDRGQIDLIEATENSVNTVYAQLNQDVGPQATRDVAVRAGLPETTVGLGTELTNVLGTASPHAIDMAGVFATYAAQGVSHQTHVIDHVTDTNGTIIYTGPTAGTQVFSASVMADATYAMERVVKDGTGETASELDRPVAGKTGSSNDYRSASFAGYIPQLATVVALYQPGPNGEEETITPFDGYRVISGGSVPTTLWTEYMKVATQGMPVENFPARTATATPSSTPTPSETPTEEIVDVPNVVGLSLAEARDALVAAGFAVAQVSEGSEVPAGVVIRSEPGAGTAVSGSTITIVISTGPAPEPTPTETVTTPPPPTPTPTPTPDPTPTPTLTPTPDPTPSTVG